MIIIVATFAQALSGNAHAVHIIGVLIVWRFIVSITLLLSFPSHIWSRWASELAVIIL